MNNKLEGRIYSKLTVLRPAKYLGKTNRFRWLCVCECGKHCYAHTNNLKAGSKKSCGCGSQKNSVSGLSKTPAYQSWVAMHKRCYSITSMFYSKYGEVGITVCERWQNFHLFLVDMQQPNHRSLTIERRNNGLGYFPENCYWATKIEQARNRGRFNNNSSGRTGVYRLPSGKFRSTITVNKTTKSLGCFNTYEEACLARSGAEYHYFGFIKE